MLKRVRPRLCSVEVWNSASRGEPLSLPLAERVRDHGMKGAVRTERREHPTLSGRKASWRKQCLNWHLKSSSLSEGTAVSDTMIPLSTSPR